MVVDTRSPSRLGEVFDLSPPAAARSLSSTTTWRKKRTGSTPPKSIVRPVGATCTIIADLYRERGIEPTVNEASLMLMGIYEDTGGLSYRETTPDDLRIAAWLLEQGASLAWVRRWVLKVLQPDQLELLNRMVEATEVIDIAGVPVSLSMLEVDRYHEEAAFVVHRWVEIFEIVVGAVLLVRPPNINLILRSRLPGLHVGRVAQQFGGGGHPTAASARVADIMPVELREVLLEALADRNAAAGDGHRYRRPQDLFSRRHRDRRRRQGTHQPPPRQRPAGRGHQHPAAWSAWSLVRPSTAPSATA